MRCWLSILACAAAIGCTANNPNFVGNGSMSGADMSLGGGANGGSGGGGAGGGGGGGGAHDMAMSGGQQDMTVFACTGDQRLCIQTPSPTSVFCNSGTFAKDRVCPFGNSTGGGSVCQSGYCQPPTTNGTTSCGTGGPLEQICEQIGGSAKNFSCQPFITNPATASVQWWCAVAANRGAGVAGSSCTKDSDCHTGFCGSNGTCYWACQSTSDCLSSVLLCKSVTIEVEHVAVTALSCAP